MRINEYQITKLELDNGKTPFDDWFKSLKDKKLQQKVDARLTRASSGSLGDHRSLGRGVYELRIHQGPGLRIYFAFYRSNLLVLIGGGSKNSQKRDIARAMQLWRKFRNEA